MKTSIRILLPVVLIGSFAGGAAFAKPVAPAKVVASTTLPELKDAPRLRLVLRQIIRELGLTSEQVKAAREVLKAHREDVSAAFDAVVAAREDLRAAIRATPTDETALAAAADEVGAAQRDLALATALLRADLRLILTAEQLAKLEKIETRVTDRIDKVREVLEQWVKAA